MIPSGTNDNVRLNYCEAENFSSLQQFVILICIPPPYRAHNTPTHFFHSHFQLLYGVI